MGSKEVSQEESAFPLTEVDRWVLSQPDEEFQLHTWTDLKDIIGKLCSSHCVTLLLYFGITSYHNAIACGFCLLLLEQYLFGLPPANRPFSTANNRLEVFKRRPSDLRRY